MEFRFNEELKHNSSSHIREFNKETQKKKRRGGEEGRGERRRQSTKIILKVNIARSFYSLRIGKDSNLYLGLIG